MSGISDSTNLVYALVKAYTALEESEQYLYEVDASSSDGRSDQRKKNEEALREARKALGWAEPATAKKIPKGPQHVHAKDLEGILLDAAVARAMGVNVRYSVADDFCVRYTGGDDTGLKERRGQEFNPSDDWTLAGPTIEHEKLHLVPFGNDGWQAFLPVSAASERGPTPLIAAMRAYVANELGNTFLMANSNVEGDD